MDFSEILSRGLLAATGPTALAYAIAAQGLNLQFGYTGLLNFGHIAFMMMGAYGTAITVSMGGSLWFGVIVGILAAMALGLALGIPTLKLRAEYLAIATIAVSEVLRLYVRSSWSHDLTGSVFGIQGISGDFHALNPLPERTVFKLVCIGDDCSTLELAVTSGRLWVMIVSGVLLLAVTLLVWRLIDSPWGRLIRAIREDEDAAASLGKNVFARKLQVLVIGGAIGGLAGVLPALERGSVVPDTYLPRVTFILYMIVILGGAATIWGPVIGAFAFQFLFFSLDELMQQAQANIGWVNTLISSTGAGRVRWVALGLGLMALLVFRPQGIMGDPEEALFSD